MNIRILTCAGDTLFLGSCQKEGLPRGGGYFERGCIFLIYVNVHTQHV